MENLPDWYPTPAWAWFWFKGGWDIGPKLGVSRPKQGWISLRTAWRLARKNERGVRERLLIPQNPSARESSYTWLGKRVVGLVDIADGIVTFFGPKKTFGGWGMSFVCWCATRPLERRVASQKKAEETLCGCGNGDYRTCPCEQVD